MEHSKYCGYAANMRGERTVLNTSMLIITVSDDLYSFDLKYENNIPHIIQLAEEKYICKFRKSVELILKDDLNLLHKYIMA